MRSLFVKRKQGEDNLLIILTTSVLTILLTRLFLDLTGYPQIGNNVLHIAHLLWGGLFLLIAMIFLVLYKGVLIRKISSFLAGIGWGLFFDEVGKFITQNNDYHFKPAASVIYIFFLLLTGIYIYLFRKRNNLSEKEIVYDAVDNLEEIIENDLDSKEKEEILFNLEYVSETSEDETLKKLSKDLLELIKSHNIQVQVEDTFSHFLVKEISEFINKLFSKKEFSIFMLFLSILYFIYSMGYIITSSIGIIFYSQLPQDITTFLFGTYDISSEINIYILLITFAVSSFSFLIISLTIYLQIIKDQRKFLNDLSLYLLIFLIVFLNIFVFYISQFSAVIILLFQILIFNFIKSFKNDTRTDSA